jgi:hypothetical protein
MSGGGRFERGDIDTKMIAIDHKLEMEDYVAAQFYMATKSEMYQKQKRFTHRVVPLIYAVIGVVLFLLQFRSTPIFAILVSVLWFILFPIYNRRSQIKTHRAMYTQFLKDFPGSSGRISMDETYILSEENGLDLKLYGSGVRYIAELAHTVVIASNSNLFLAFSKDGVEGIEEFCGALRKFATDNEIPYSQDLNWKY